MIQIVQDNFVIINDIKLYVYLKDIEENRSLKCTPNYLKLFIEFVKKNDNKWIFWDEHVPEYTYTDEQKSLTRIARVYADYDIENYPCTGFVSKSIYFELETIYNNKKRVKKVYEYCVQILENTDKNMFG